MDTQLAYEQYVNLLWELLHSNCPVDTGNMKHHIRIANDTGTSCEIIIETIPYTKAKRKQTGRWQHSKQTEYASITEFENTKNKGWVREKSILQAAQIVAQEVKNY